MQSCEDTALEDVVHHQPLGQDRKTLLRAWEQAWVARKYDEAGTFALLLRDLENGECQ